MKRACATTAAVLCAALPVLTARTKNPFHAGNITNPPQYAAFSQPLTQDEMLRHALGRLTFGPTPGDLDAAKRIGLKKWFDTQLNPDRLPENPLLAAKLEPLDSVRMGIRETYLHYPPPQFIAAVARGRQMPPDDPELRQVVKRLADRYLRRQEARAHDAPGVSSKTAQSLDSDGEADLSSAVPLTSILHPDQIALLEHGDPEQKRQILSSIPEAQLMDFVYALRPGQRRKLLPVAPVHLERKLLMSVAPAQVVLNDLSQAKILRAAYSNRQMQEEMADFWFNHFNVFFNKGGDRYMLPAYERDAIRAHALGKFPDLLLATAKSPAMLFYLDNWESVAPDLDQRGPQYVRRPNQSKRGLNENYGRELMELHTLGVGGGYTQKDVVDVARCFTGWTIAAPRKGGGFEYNDRVHDKGRKVVLGYVIEAGGGMGDGLKVLDILCRAPQTAKHISYELSQRFVADEPPPSLVDRMSKTFLKTGGDMREVLKTMVLSPEFFSKGAYQAKVKSPFEMVVSAIRATSADVDSAFILTQQIAQLGEPLYRKIEPTGYSNANTEWVNSASLLTRLNFALGLAGNHFAGIRVDEQRWAGVASADPVDLARGLLAAEPAAQTVQAIQKALSSQSVRDQLAQSAKLKTPQMPALVAGLVLGSPEFQRR